MADEIKAALLGAGALVVGYAMWMRSLRHRNLIRATATSRIATAASGFVELTGIARKAEAEVLHDPVRFVSCLWFHVVTEKREWSNRMRWRTVNRRTSTQRFVIEDDSGACTVETHEAEIDRHEPDDIVSERWNLRHKIWRIREGDRLYALGHIDHAAGLAHAAAIASAEARTLDVLREWKRDQRQLVAAFDADGDGRIDQLEWEEARRTARAQIDAQLVSQPPGTGSTLATGRGATHSLRRPSDGRPLLLSKRGEEQLARAHLSTSIGGAAIFAFGVCALLFTLKACVGG
jgi:hypothetical protein